MTDEQKKFVEELTTKMTDQNNRMTHFPIFWIYDVDEVAVDERVDYDRVAFFDSSNPGLTTEEEDENGNKWTFDGNGYGDWECKELGEVMHDYDAEEKFEIEKIYLKRVDKPIVDVGPFLTEEAAQRHIDANKHHYNTPYIYVNSLWRNYEMQEVLKLLFALAGKEIPSQYK